MIPHTQLLTARADRAIGAFVDRRDNLRGILGFRSNEYHSSFSMKPSARLEPMLASAVVV